MENFPFSILRAASTFVSSCFRFMYVSNYCTYIQPHRVCICLSDRTRGTSKIPLYNSVVHLPPLPSSLVLIG